MESFHHSLHPFWIINLWFCFAQMFENVLPIMRMCERFWVCTTLNDTKCQNFRRGSEVEQQFFSLFRAQQGLFCTPAAMWRGHCSSLGTVPLSTHQYIHTLEWFVFIYTYLNIMIMIVKCMCTSLWTFIAHFIKQRNKIFIQSGHCPFIFSVLTDSHFKYC